MVHNTSTLTPCAWQQGIDVLNICYSVHAQQFAFHLLGICIDYCNSFTVIWVYLNSATLSVMFPEVHRFSVIDVVNKYHFHFVQHVVLLPCLQYYEWMLFSLAFIWFVFNFSHTYYYWYSITHSLFHSRLKSFLFCKSSLPQPFLSLLQVSL